MMTEEQYNFVKYYERSFREHWDLEAVTDYGTNVTLTYGQLAINIAKLHILFKECGIKKNDKIAVMGKNTSNWIAVYLATITYGAIIVPILQDFRANDAIHIINHSGSKLLFISDINWEGIDLDQIQDWRMKKKDPKTEKEPEALDNGIPVDQTKKRKVKLDALMKAEKEANKELHDKKDNERIERQRVKADRAMKKAMGKGKDVLQ